MESAEHAWIGDQVTLDFKSGESGIPAKERPLNIGPGYLTYGQCIALGGDFYGVVGGPISTSPNPENAFLAAFNTLTTGWDQVAPILEIMAEEIAAVERALKDGREPSLVYASLGDSLSYRWNVVTGGGSVISKAWPMGRYLSLAAENWDHFTHYAVTAYRAGHLAAMREAVAAAAMDGSPEEKAARLSHAYAMNAFADHFLTDLFSAGHMRAPRKELYDQVTTPVPGYSGSLGSLLTRCMHDEDSYHGLNVSNKAGNSWLAYGDKRLLDSVSADNRKMVVEAVQTSASEVWKAYTGGPPESLDGALNYIPDLEQVGNVKTKNNFSPLFLLQDNVAARRNDVENRQDYSWMDNWWGWSTYALLISTHAYENVKCYDFSTKEFRGWLGVTGHNYTSVEKDEKNAHGCFWAFKDGDLYLRKQTSGSADRDLGEGSGGYADWGLGAGYYAAVLYNEDLTVSLQAEPSRKLYLHEDLHQVLWSDKDNPSPPRLLRIELPLRGPSMSC